ncbi:MAG: hypothetical protein OXB84_07795, partial [Halobacteriovoraceae bacterium]|nr:hypothetical protein [Halobacteriovoraceae bacterium]
DYILIAHHFALPTKIADNGRILNNNFPHYFTSSLDSFTNYSGSPVINVKTGLVEGILHHGERPDHKGYLNEKGESCGKIKVCGPSRGPSLCEEEERVTRISSVKGIPRHLYPLSKKEIFQRLFNFEINPGKEFFLINNSGVIPFYGYQKRSYILTGKKFLRVCGLHVVRAHDFSWQSYFAGDCEKDVKQLTNIYHNFLKLIRVF